MRPDADEDEDRVDPYKHAEAAARPFFGSTGPLARERAYVVTVPPRAKDSPLQDALHIVDGTGLFRPVGECTLVEAVDLINLAIEHCRSRRVGKLLVDAKGLVGVAVPSLVDRFLMVEQWAHQAKGMVVVVLVVRPEYIHPQKFGVRVAADFGLTADVFSSEPEALKWLASAPTAI